MRMQYVQVWTPVEMNFEIAKELSASDFTHVNWFKVSETVVICHGVDSLGRDRIGSCSFRDREDFDAVVACKLSLFDAVTKGDGYDAARSRGTQSRLETF